jgi:hypothetical protein
LIIARERKKGVLHNKLFWFKHSIKPYYADLKLLIESAGGKVLPKKNNSMK